MMTKQIVRRGVAVLLLATLVRPAALLAAPGQVQPEVMKKYVRSIQPGAAIKIKIRKQGTLKAVLLTADEDTVTVQPKTRVPEPARTIPFDLIERVELDQGGTGIGKAVAIGAAAGAGAALGVILILAAIFSD